MNIDHFLSWFKSTGVKTENVEVCYSNDYGFGLYSARSFMEKDFLILSIPEDLFLKPSLDNKDLTGFEHLIIDLLEDQINPYIEFLRSIQSIPPWCHFSNDNYPWQLRNSMKKHFKKYQQSRNKFPQYKEKDFQWAYYTINTRCVHFDMEIESKDQDDNLCLIPYLGEKRFLIGKIILII